MTLAQLQSFVLVARHGSVKGAAAELSVTEPAVSVAVSALRKELGDELFVRNGRGIALTEGGRRRSGRCSSSSSANRRTTDPVVIGSSVSIRHQTSCGSPTRSAGRQTVVRSPSTAAYGCCSGWISPKLSTSEAELDAVTLPPSMRTTLSPCPAPGYR